MFSTTAELETAVFTPPPSPTSFLQWSGEQLMLLESIVRESLTDVESQILESRLPVTVEVQEDGEEVAVPYRRP